MRILLPPNLRLANLRASLLLPLGVLLSAPAAHAAVILDVDMDASSSASITETGFSKWNFGTSDITSGPMSTTISGYSLRIAGGTSVDGSGVINGTDTYLARDRAAPTAASGFEYDLLYRDWVGGKNGVITLQIGNLEANTEYNLTLYAYDHNASGSAIFTDRTGGGAVPLGTITWTGGTVFDSATPTSIYALTTTITSDALGRITVSSVGVSNASGRFNGFVLETIPEPSAALLGVVAMAGLVKIRRRNRR